MQNNNSDPLYNQNNNKNIEKFYTDLTHLAENNLLLPFYGREKIINEMIDILNRKIKSNVILLGEPGVGKTAIVEGLALRIVTGKVPMSLIGKKIYSLNIAELLSGSRYRGDFEERLNNVLKQIISSGSGILFIDEIHTIVNSGGNSSLDIANILKPILSRSNFKCIGATTNTEYYKTFITTDGALARRFKNIYVPEMSTEETYKLLKIIKFSFEKTHNVHFGDKIIKSAIDLSNKFILNKKFPDKAIDIIDNCGSMISQKNPPKTTNKMFNKIIDLRLKKYDCIQNYDYIKAIKVRDEIKSLSKEIYNNINNTAYSTYKIVKFNVLISIISRMSDIREEIIEKFLNQIENINLLNHNDKKTKDVTTINESLNKCINIILKNFYFYDISNYPVGRFIYVKNKMNNSKKFCEDLAKTIYKNNDNFLYIDMQNYNITNETDVDILNDLNNTISDKISKYYNSVVLIDNFERSTYPILKSFYTIFSTGYIQNSSHKRINCKNTVFFLSIEQKKLTTNKIGFYQTNYVNNNQFNIFPTIDENNIFLKIIKISEILSINTNVNNILKSELINEINRLIKSLNNYGVEVNFSNTFIEAMYTSYFNSTVNTYNSVQEFINKKLTENLFTFIKKNIRLQSKEQKYTLRMENNEINIIENNN